MSFKLLIISLLVGQISITDGTASACPKSKELREAQGKMVLDLTVSLSEYIPTILKCRACEGCDNFQTIDKSRPECAALSDTENWIRDELQRFLRRKAALSAYVVYADGALFIERLAKDDEHRDALRMTPSWESYRGPFRSYRLGDSLEPDATFDLSQTSNSIALGIGVVHEDRYLCAVYVVYSKDDCPLEPKP